jgi:hypothetical protein
MAFPNLNEYVTTAELSPAYAGQLSDLSLCDIRSYVAEDTIDIGCVVAQGSDSKGCCTVSGVNAEAIGVAIRLDVADPSSLESDGSISVGDDVSVLTKGRIWVKAQGSPDANQRLYTMYQTNVGQVEVASTTSIDTRPQIRALGEKNSDNLVEVEVDFSNKQG